MLDHVDSNRHDFSTSRFRYASTRLICNFREKGHLLHQWADLSREDDINNSKFRGEFKKRYFVTSSFFLLVN